MCCFLQFHKNLQDETQNSSLFPACFTSSFWRNTHICGEHKPSTHLRFSLTETKPRPFSFVSAALHFDISLWIFTRQQTCLRDDSNVFVGAQVLQMTFTVCTCSPLWICGSVFAYWLLAGCWPFADNAWASAGASCGQLILPLAVMPESRSRPRGPLGICPTQLRKTDCMCAQWATWLYCSIVGLNIQMLWKIELILDDAHSCLMLFSPPCFIYLFFA